MNYGFYVRLEIYDSDVCVDSEKYNGFFGTKENLRYFQNPIGKDLFLHIKFI